MATHKPPYKIHPILIFDITSDTIFKMSINFPSNGIYSITVPTEDSPQSTNAISWARHIPSEDANESQRLSCALASSPTLGDATHASGPYFPIITTGRSAAAIITHGANSVQGNKLCWRRDFTPYAGLARFLRASRLRNSVPNAFFVLVDIVSWSDVDENQTKWYHLAGQISVRDDKDVPISVPHQGGNKELGFGHVFDYAVPQGEEDLMQTIDWKCMAALLRIGVARNFGLDGERLSLEEMLYATIQNPEPLRDLGYAEHPSYYRLDRNRGRYVSTFKRI
ncbi:uncharacterized protein LY89DRAFT_288860 [Mollisia scopiformis]|uniref:Uncharacterized protein n=1 Tax=Mollisia scopiformis TaxID=149040 RepID=A0A132BAT3_MOLSC|nr:uncharacterized protein LY89DRAFT_288860 [Mollisia scopiformis]KUJ09488.1 hypothetical protein LY89DRAFT_288860 [Mollisia scopiformis]